MMKIGRATTERRPKNQGRKKVVWLPREGEGPASLLPKPQSRQFTGDYCLPRLTESHRVASSSHRDRTRRCTSNTHPSRHQDSSNLVYPLHPENPTRSCPAEKQGTKESITTKETCR
ncbi:hypothetical protein LZ32DRAFT_106415 [Colletotrichum eremochloae]|nr:hypothetical protein LZ32DRAFT_106415 [Colletotrichum eremochloae]